jgi:hypothetical protein
VEALVLLVSDGILYYAIALDPGVQQGVVLDLHQRLYPRLVLLLILLLESLPLLKVVRVYQRDYETLPLVLFDLVRREHEHFLMIHLREELDAGLSVQPEGLLYLSTLTSNVLT